jgi:hypothetical protein
MGVTDEQVVRLVRDRLGDLEAILDELIARFESEIAASIIATPPGDGMTDALLNVKCNFCGAVLAANREALGLLVEEHYMEKHGTIRPFALSPIDPPLAQHKPECLTRHEMNTGCDCGASTQAEELERLRAVVQYAANMPDAENMPEWAKELRHHARSALQPPTQHAATCLTRFEMNAGCDCQPPTQQGEPK